MKILRVCLLVIVVLTASLTAEQKEPPVKDPAFILNECIKQQGGADKFNQIQDIYAKMDVRTVSQDGDIESIFYEYFRKPDKLRIEIHPLVDPPTKISWDGKDAWQMAKNQLEKAQDEKLGERLQESLRFLRLMMLTNLLEKGSELMYERYIPKTAFGIHVISQVDSRKEKVKLFISDNNYTLLGAEFYWDNATTLLRVMFANHKWIEGLLLPVNTKVYKENQLVMDVKLKTLQVNALKNGNTFFQNLNETAQLK
jgi:outer membrane lipoprotein-sorting protein